MDSRVSNKKSLTNHFQNCFNILVDFDPDKGDTQSGNCEVILNNHGDMNIFTQPNKIQSQLKAFGIGSSKDEIDINDLGKTIGD